MEMGNSFYAHSLEGEPPERWQPLEEHLKNVAERAETFAAKFGGDKWAYLAGLWHDLGKYSHAFQSKLYRENGLETDFKSKGPVIHSEAGGHLAVLKGIKGADTVLSWLIMGHHAGLADYESDETGAKALRVKMAHPERSRNVFHYVPPWIINHPIPKQPIPKGASPSFFIRMLFSCLVDADFLDTERFMNKNRAKLRSFSYPSIKELRDALMCFMEELMQKAPGTPVNEIRRQVFWQCVQKAQTDENLFTLTVPTGGGKTLASLAFALHHAVYHKKDRIIYVIPYTNIIEQTADVFRGIPGFERAVLEHHSNLVDDKGSENLDTVFRLAAENWDAPIIVTTAVQFFESLYSCKSSQCRRLHNITNSVVIFDEAQSFPSGFLRPIVFAIRELNKFYGVTPLFCTATQPVLTKSKAFDFEFSEGFDKEPVEIIKEAESLSQKLKRVEIELIDRGLAPIDEESLAGILDKVDSSLLCIVNLRDQARKVAKLLKRGKVFHLSTNMCPQHRRYVLDNIKKLLKQKSNTPIKVISTSLVEAGVDLDFPLVYRALAGLDSIIQAAGRCNREGRMNELGRVFVFRLSKEPSYVAQQASLAEGFLLDAEKRRSLHTPKTMTSYFTRWYWQLGDDGMDKKNILKLLGGPWPNYYFRTASERFHLIEDRHQVSVLVPYGNVLDLVARLDSEPWHERSLLRRLQQYSVNIFVDQFQILGQKGLIHTVLDEENPLYLVDGSLYHPEFGLLPLDEAIEQEPQDFIV